MRLADYIRPNPGKPPKGINWYFGVFWVCVGLLVWISGAAAFLPTPMDTLRALPDLWNNEGLGHELYVSFTLNLTAVSIMVVISYLIALATVMLPFRSLATLISSGRFNGFVGLPFVLMSILHNPYYVKIALLVFGMGVFTVLSLVKMIENIPKEQFDHAKTLRMGDWRHIAEVVVFGTMDQTIDIFRVNIAMGWMMLPLVEGMYKYQGGVGALMLNEQKHLNLAPVFCTLFVILIAGLLQDGAIGWLKRMLCSYAFLGTERE